MPQNNFQVTIIGMWFVSGTWEESYHVLPDAVSVVVPYRRHIARGRNTSVLKTQRLRYRSSSEVRFSALQPGVDMEGELVART